MEGLHHWHRAQQQRRLAGIAADTIRLSREEYQQLTARDAKEISYMGRMYDIFSATITADGVMLAGHYDDFDNELFKILDALLDEGTDMPGHQAPRLFVFTAILPGPMVWAPARLGDVYPQYQIVGCRTISSAIQDVLIAPPETRA